MCFIFMLTLTLTLTSNCVVGLFLMHNYIKQGNQLNSVCVCFFFMYLTSVKRCSLGQQSFYYSTLENKKIIILYLCCSARKCINQHTYKTQKTFYFHDIVAQSVIHFALNMWKIKANTMIYWTNTEQNVRKT